jgi:hypothetical protein
MIHRKLLAGAAVLGFAVGGLVLSWVSAHATTLEPVTISAPAIEVVGRRDTRLPLQRIKVTAHVAFTPMTVTPDSAVATPATPARSEPRS